MAETGGCVRLTATLPQPESVSVRPESSKKLVVCLGRFGDLVNILPLAYADFLKGSRWSVMVSKDFINVLEGVSYVDPVVFDGPMFALDAAMEQARAINPEAMTSQLVGPPDTIKQVVVRRNGREYRALTESFQKDAWNLLGRLNDWRNQVRPVFDRRSEQREAALIASVLPKNKKKHILVFHKGTSSPFQYSSLLLEMLRLSLGKQFNIVDCSDVKAERIYDLLGLMEKAHCVVSTDSAPLHLAYAIEGLPVVALVQDKPSLWHGSVWREGHIFHSRYRDFPGRAVEMMQAIRSIGSAGCYFNPVTEKPKIIHAWSQYELTDDNRLRHGDARETWLEEYRAGRWVSCAAEFGVFGRDSRNMLLLGSNSEKPIHDEKRIPEAKDVIRLAMLRAGQDDIICLTRCDTCFTDGLGEKIAASKLPCFAQRKIREADGSLMHHPAFDLFAFTKSWWREKQGKYPQMLMGSDPYWHKVLLEMIRADGGVELPEAIYRHPSPPPPAKGPDEQAPARVQHNENLCRKWIEDNKPRPIIPAAINQLPHFPLNRRGLSPFGYNPSIIRHKFKLLLAYRWHPDGDPATRLAMAELDEQGNVLENGDIRILGVPGSTEDVKLFELGGELCMSFVVSTWPNNPPKSVVKWGKLTKESGWIVRETFQPVYGRNDGSIMEKGWVPFDYKGKPHFLYHPQMPGEVNGHIVIELDGEKVVNEYKTPSLRWPYGYLKGGTPPIEYKGKWLRFLHGTLDNEPPIWRRRYYITACLIDPEPPFAFVSLMQKPLIRGSEADDLAPIEKSSCFHYKPQVAYPGGVIRDGNDFLLAYGINDCASAVARITESDLKL